jgi:hypothetical protein
MNRTDQDLNNLTREEEKKSKLEEHAKAGLSILPTNGSAIIDAKNVIPLMDPLILEFLVCSGKRHRPLNLTFHQLIPHDARVIESSFPHELLHFSWAQAYMAKGNGVTLNP